MTVPKAGDKLKIVSLGSDAGIGQKQVTSVELLGEKNKIEWKQEADGLSIVYPDSAHLKTAVGFRIVCSRSLKSAHLRDIVRKQYSADFFNKPQKNPHGSFEVVCSGS